ncbi:MAG: hypothetical protein R2834_15940 [Rhodothermales bacterium]
MKRLHARNSLRRSSVLIVALCLLVLPSSRAQDWEADEGVIVRVNGDLVVPAGEREAVALVIEGNARVSGEAELVVVVNGTAELTGARIGELVVVQGEAMLDDASEVTGNVHLVNAELTRADGATIQGEVLHDTGTRLGRGLLIFGLLFAMGSVITVLACGLVAAAIAPRGVRTAGAALTDTFGTTLVATLIVWVGLPIFAAAMIGTVVGIPIGLGIFLFILPAMGFLGYLVSGIRLGDYVLGVIRGRDEAWHPYLAALVGLVILLFLGTVPILGSIVSPIAAMLGAGAIGVLAWRQVRRPREAEVAA